MNFSKPKVRPSFPPIDQEARTGVATEQGAFYLNRAPQTLRKWHCQGGPITPKRVNGRLIWMIADIKALLSGEKVSL